MIGRLIEQQDVRLLHQGFCDRQAFAPAAGEAGCIGGKILKAGAAQGFTDASLPL